MGEPAILASEARAWWRALVENVTALLEDATVLLDRGSPGRARSLGILASEELGKAQWIYDFASHAWSGGARTVALPEWFVRGERHHPRKIENALRYGEGLEVFWGGPPPDPASAPALGDEAGWDEWIAARGERFRTQAAAINLEKQEGFYVDRSDGHVSSPVAVPADGVCEELERLAGVGLMHLIEDHSRMKFDVADGVPYDSTHGLQFRLMVLGGAPADEG